MLNLVTVGRVAAVETRGQIIALVIKNRRDEGNTARLRNTRWSHSCTFHLSILLFFLQWQPRD